MTDTETRWATIYTTHKLTSPKPYPPEAVLTVVERVLNEIKEPVIELIEVEQVFAEQCYRIAVIVPSYSKTMLIVTMRVGDRASYETLMSGRVCFNLINVNVLHQNDVRQRNFIPVKVSFGDAVRFFQQDYICSIVPKIQSAIVDITARLKLLEDTVELHPDSQAVEKLKTDYEKRVVEQLSSI